MTGLYETPADDESDQPITLQYQITNYPSHTQSYTLYGVSVEKTLHELIVDRAETGAISDDVHVASALLETLERCQVTPITLCCIVDQLLDERETE